MQMINYKDKLTIA